MGSVEKEVERKSEKQVNLTSNPTDSLSLEQLKVHVNELRNAAMLGLGKFKKELNSDDNINSIETNIKGLVNMLELFNVDASYSPESIKSNLPIINQVCDKLLSIQTEVM